MKIYGLGMGLKDDRGDEIRRFNGMKYKPEINKTNRNGMVVSSCVILQFSSFQGQFLWEDVQGGLPTKYYSYTTRP